MTDSGIRVVSIGFLSFYFLGVLFPEAWWGTHYLAFLPPFLKYSLLALASLITLVPAFEKVANAFTNGDGKNSARFGSLLIISIGILWGTLFHQFPIVKDAYGTAFVSRAFVHEKVETLPEDFFDRLFSFAASPSHGRTGRRQLVTITAWFGDLTYEEAFRRIDTICGVLFVMIWLFYVQRSLHRRVWQFILGLAGLTAPFLQIFFGHIETRAPISLLILVWVIGISRQLETKSPTLLWSLLILLVIGVRFHAFLVLLTPGWLLAFLSHYFHGQPISKQLLTSKGGLLWIYLPICAIGASLYFFVFEDYKDERLLQHVRDIDRLFLPLLAPDPPLDRYNLISLNHIFDFFNAVLHWSPPILFVVVCVVLFYRKKIDWRRQQVAVLGLTLLLFITLLFMINPLASPPMDWDLFSMPAPVLLVFTLLLVKQIQNADLGQKVLPGCVALSLLSTPIFAVNASVKSHSYRLENVGIHVYRTYYEHAGTIIHYALGMIEDNLELYLHRKEKILKKLENEAIPGNDVKYAMLLTDSGFYYLRDKQEFARARDYFRRASDYAPNYGINLVYLMEVNFELQDFHAAYENARQLIQLEHPDKRTALRFGIHCALEAELFAKAKEHCKAYLRNFPEDALVRTIFDRLRTNSNVEELRFLFARDRNQR